MAEPALVQVNILGLRDLQGRFARMIEGELKAIQMENAEAAGEAVKRIYQLWAPKGTGESPHGHFWEGIENQAFWTGKGFAVTLTTADPKLRQWLAEGTGVYGPIGEPIYPTKGEFLHFFIEGQEFFVRSILGMKPNDWEVFAALQAAPLMLEAGNRIGREVVSGLRGVA